jgi:hypothetical protein
VAFTRVFCVVLLLVASVATYAKAQDTRLAPVAPTTDQFFSGSITDLNDKSVTVNRTVLGKQNSTRSFLITPETRVEGKLRVHARVTVRYVASEDGDRAVHIVVRSAPPPKKDH